MPFFNPFARRETHSSTSLLAHRILIILSWLVLVITTIYYTSNAPHDDWKGGRGTIWSHNRPTPFALNSVIVSIYWIVLFIFQIGYIWRLFSNTDHLNAAVGVGSYFTFSNLLQFAFVMLFVRSHFILAEIILVINYFNLTSLYFYHNSHPWFIHVPVVAGPLAWNFIALFWNGALAAHATGIAARIVANVAIWAIFVYGLSFLITYRDYTMGFALSVLTASLGVQQFLIKVISLQWIFAFVIMGVLFVTTLLVVSPNAFGQRGIRREEAAAPADQERAPLLDDQ